MSADEALKILENLPTKKGHVGKMMVHDFSQCASKTGEWRIIFCSDFGYTEPVYGRTILECIENGIKFLES